MELEIKSTTRLLTTLKASGSSPPLLQLSMARLSTNPATRQLPILAQLWPLLVIRFAKLFTMLSLEQPTTVSSRATSSPLTLPLTSCLLSMLPLEIHCSRFRRKTWHLPMLATEWFLVAFNLAAKTPLISLAIPSLRASTR
jgi:hypothetical protein